MSASTKIETVRKEVKELEGNYNELYGLMFINDRNLSDAGRGVIAELKRRKMRQKDACRVLGISPAAAYNHWHNVA